MKPFLPLIGLSFLLVLTPSLVAAEVATDGLTVAVRHVPPFAIKDQQGNWHGISIELWRAIANKLSLEYRFREIVSLKEMLDAVERAEVGAAVAALTITSEREKRVDFTHPFLSTGLGIAVPRDAGGGWLSVTQRFVAPAYLKVRSPDLEDFNMTGVQQNAGQADEFHDG